MKAIKTRKQGINKNESKKDRNKSRESKCKECNKGSDQERT